MKDSVLILEGGGMRCIYTAGVLEAFLEHQIEFKDIYGVSAGATAGVSFISRQKGRNKRVFSDYVRDPRYMGLKHLFTKGNYFNKDFIFDVIPNRLDPLDYTAFKNSNSTLYTPLTNCHTGESEMFSMPANIADMRTILEATTSLPILANPVIYRDQHYLDGGVATPLILDEVLEQGYKHIVYVLTRPQGYIRKPQKHMWYIGFQLRKYPAILEHLRRRHDVYNDTRKRIKKLAKEKVLTVIEPAEDFKVSRIEHDPKLVEAGYLMGYQHAVKHLKELQKI